VLLPTLASLRLSTPDLDVRRSAAEELAKRPDLDLGPLMRSALAKDDDDEVRESLALALAQLDVKSPEAKRRIEALAVLGDSGDVAFKADLER
jgi:urea transport system permease protein